jgi:SAM-dependent methyltransferase
MKCVICDNADLIPVVHRKEPAITSLAEIVQLETKVLACRQCGHVQTQAVIDTSSYYENDYHLHAFAGDDDVVVVGRNKHVPRSQYQFEILNRKFDFGRVTNILEYGAGKGNMLKQISSQGYPVNLHAYELAEKHLDSWKDIIPVENMASRGLPDVWSNKFNLVYSSFVLEHCANPVAVLEVLHGTLREDGVAIIVIPDPCFNNIDLLAVDHLNHFTQSSLYKATGLAGFDIDEIDSQSQPGALWVTMKKAAGRSAYNHDLDDVDYLISAGSWFSTAESCLRDFAAQVSANKRVYIYGAGVWGAFVLSVLQQILNVTALIDQNPSLHGRTLHGLDVFSPDQIEDDDIVILCALNPKIARRVMQETFSYLLERGDVFCFEDYDTTVTT